MWTPLVGAGVLICGPPGTGKTALALACAEAAKRCHANFLSVQCPAIISKWVDGFEVIYFVLNLGER